MIFMGVLARLKKSNLLYGKTMYPGNIILMLQQQQHTQ